MLGVEPHGLKGFPPFGSPGSPANLIAFQLELEYGPNSLFKPSQ